jgi:hypothetical protein
MSQTHDSPLDERTIRLLEHAMKQLAARRAEFGHLPPLEYMAAVEARRGQEDAELEALINAGHFDTPRDQR